MGTITSGFPAQHCPSLKFSPAPVHSADCSALANTQQSFPVGWESSLKVLEIRNLAGTHQTQGHTQGSCVIMGMTDFTYGDKEKPR